jgi:hypothetical protein
VELFQGFASRLVEALDLPATHARRAALLRPVYRVKWCCIMLNEFLPVGARRRGFALDPREARDRRERQLRGARAALARVASEDTV